MAQAAPQIKSAADRRQHRRIETAWSALLLLGNQPLRCVVVNISVGGAKISVDAADPDAGLKALQTGSSVVLNINGIGEFAGKIAWVDGAEGGIQFAEDPAKVAQYLEFAAASRPASAG